MSWICQLEPLKIPVKRTRPYGIEFFDIKASLATDGKQLDSDPKIEQVFGAHDSLLPLLVATKRVIIVCDNEQPAGSEVWGSGGENLVCAEKHVSDRGIPAGRT